MFLDNKYTKIYYQMMDKALLREQPEEYSEKHHIVPKSLGGSDDEDNLVYLLPREHYVAHTLLTKMLVGKDKRKMTFALHTFFHFNKQRKLDFTSRQYEYHREQFAVACKGRVPHTKPNVYRFKHRKSLEEFVGTISEFRHHTSLTSQEVNWLRVASTDETVSTRWIKDWGIWVDILQKWSYNKKFKSTPHPRVACEHCNKEVSPGNYSRWHGDKCKEVDDDGHYDRTRQVATINGHR